MSSKWSSTPEDFNLTMSDYLNDYLEDIEEDVVKNTNSIIKEAKAELIATSPKGANDEKDERDEPYYQGWAVKTAKKGIHKYSRVVWNKTNYRLTHLLEFGHVKRNGTDWVEAQPHIRPVEKKYKVKFTEKLLYDIKKRRQV